MTTPNEDIVRRYSHDAWIKGDLDVIDKLFSADFVNHDAFAGSDRESYKDYVRQHREGLADRTARLDDVIIADDRVVTRWHVKGRHVGKVLGVHPTGRTAVMRGISIYRLENGNIVEKWNEASLHIDDND